jgi:hypothetical protein
MIVRVIRRVDRRTERLVVLTLVAIVILIRSAIFVFYWDAYAVSFLTNEQIIMKAEGFPRIYQYDHEVEAHIAEAVRISRTPCTGGEEAVPGRYLCPP